MILLVIILTLLSPVPFVKRSEEVLVLLARVICYNHGYHESGLAPLLMLQLFLHASAGIRCEG
jgi:hypothetical protein